MIAAVTVERALKGSGIPREDAEILLATLLRVDRSWFIAHGANELSPMHWKKFQSWIDRRKNFEPVLYITGGIEFFGRSFRIDKRALIPRPSTEGLVSFALDFLKTGKEEARELDSKILGVAKKLGDLSDVRTLVDIGTGSGCIAVTLALERPDFRVIATDISEDALSLAKENAALLGVAGRIQFRKGDGLQPIQNFSEPFLVVSNPPYIPRSRALPLDVADFEPRVALFGGRDGSEVLKSIVEDAKKHPQCRGFVLECEEEQLRNL